MKHSDTPVSVLERSTLDWLKSPLSQAEPEWLAQRRVAAREYFCAHGLPKAHDESFRFLPLTSITSRQLRQAPAQNSPVLGVEDAEWSASIGFFDGIPVGNVAHLPHGLRIDRLKHLLTVDSGNLRSLLGHIATPINGFAALGLALFDD